MKNLRMVFWAAFLCFNFFGCNSVGKVMPANDSVLTYKLPYDLTYLRTLEALDSATDWQLQATEKEKGTINVRDTNFSRLDDSDKCTITFVVKRVDRETTSVSILPKDQHVYGGEKLLKKVGDYLSRELRN